MNQLYPVFIKLQDETCVIVGGGTVAFRKTEALLQAQAKVTVISPALCDELRDLVKHKKVTYIKRNFQPGDLDEAFLVIAATDDGETNQLVWKEAGQRKLLVNVVDVPSQCNFYVPSVVRDGDLAVAISTNGKAPYLAKRLRQKLTAYLRPFNFGKLIEMIDLKRQKLKDQYPDDIQKRERHIKDFIDDLLSRNGETAILKK